MNFGLYTYMIKYKYPVDLYKTNNYLYIAE